MKITRRQLRKLISEAYQPPIGGSISGTVKINMEPGRGYVIEDKHGNITEVDNPIVFLNELMNQGHDRVYDEIIDEIFDIDIYIKQLESFMGDFEEFGDMDYDPLMASEPYDLLSRDFDEFDDFDVNLDLDILDKEESEEESSFDDDWI
jgi:hypothetical protein